MTTYAGYGVNYLADLKAIPPEDRCNLMCIAVLEKKAWYQFSSGSVQTPDDNLIVTPSTGDGQWLALGTPTTSGGGSTGGGGMPIYRSDSTNPIADNIAPDFAGQFFVGGTSSGSCTVWVAVGSTVNDWKSIYYFSNS